VTKLSLVVDVRSQRLQCLYQGKVQKSYTIATASKGVGEIQGSECTPRGWHEIHEKIGGEAAIGTVFVGRSPTGECYSQTLAESFPQRDWILTRILWLSGLEAGKNLGGVVDTLRRYIYIHGCPDEIALGTPSSHGCIRMHSADVIDLFDRVDVGTKVLIL